MKLEALRQLREKTNPFELSAAINKKLCVIWALASKANLRRADKPAVSKRKRFWEQPGEYELPTHLFLPLRNITLDRIREQYARESRLHMN